MNRCLKPIFQKSYPVLNRYFAVGMAAKKQSIVWMDLEMTGLDIKRDKIMEVSCLITDANLNITSEAQTIIVHQPEEVLNSMNEWCKKTHAKNGLWELCLNSKTSIKDAEEILLDYLKKEVPRQVCPLAGNTIYMDRIFLNEFMPKIHEYLHYRIIDVSSIKELCRRWQPNIFSKAPKKSLNHRSLDDIKETIKELKFYKKNFFIDTLK